MGHISATFSTSFLKTITFFFIKKQKKLSLNINIIRFESLLMLKTFFNFENIKMFSSRFIVCVLHNKIVLAYFQRVFKSNLRAGKKIQTERKIK